MKRHVTISARLVRDPETCRDHGGTICRLCPCCVASLVKLLHGLSDDPPALRHACCDIIRTIGGTNELAGYVTLEDAARQTFVRRAVAPVPPAPRDPSTAAEGEPYLLDDATEAPGLFRRWLRRRGR